MNKKVLKMQKKYKIMKNILTVFAGRKQNLEYVKII
jgi:hypothetical protein